ncbi:MAG TPA: transcription-repair coupling factor [Clostridiales bacterium]|nr:transcription-repair coupling factor [Clostridiales bacterium]
METAKQRSIFTGAVRSDPEYRQLLEAVGVQRRANPKPVLVTGLCEGACDALCAALAEDIPGGRPVLVVCPEEKECLRLASICTVLGLRAAFYPVRDLNFYNMTASREFEHNRLGILFGITGGLFDVILTTPDAALGYTMPPSALSEHLITVSLEGSADAGAGAGGVEALAMRLSAAGYIRADAASSETLGRSGLVEGPGQFAVRGGIVDVYAPSMRIVRADGSRGGGSFALRIEFFGDEIDRMGLFDTATQRVTEQIRSATLAPARELLAGRDELEEIEAAVRLLRRRTKDQRVMDELDGELSAIGTALESGSEVRFLDKYISLVYSEKTCLLDYFSPMTLCLIRGNAAVNDRLKAAEWHAAKEAEEMVTSGVIAGKYAEYSAPASALSNFISRHTTVLLDSLMQGMSGAELGGLYGFRTKHALSCAGNDMLLREELENYFKSGCRVVIMAGSEASAANYAGLLREWGYSARDEGDGSSLDPDTIGRGEAAVISEAPVSPFEMTVPRIAIITVLADARAGAVSASSRARKRKKRDSATEQIMSYADLSVGDYVVHESHGIGRYLGITTMEVDGVTRDYVTIQYAGSDRLFMPVEKLDKVSKYIGARADDDTLRLSKFGGAEWGKTKAKTKASLKNIAKELIKLYAERMRRPGFAFPKDDDFQRDFESAFEYEETSAQLDATEDIKEDMEKPRPMDRLLCGDVGYGKTEVALRAAYKAIVAGKQVALLVPTTILALQHYQTATSRMRAFAVNVEMLSRFRTDKQQKKIIADIARGDIDLIIGTHRLLSNDIKFSDLGLLIVDEEQRFGVAQKEKIKQAAGNVDVLSLSATPIPRTLNMAMTGIRDISVLDEAPDDRMPVQTYVLEHDDIIIMDAIKRELRRGGQVFYLHNTVETIDGVAAKIAKEIPEATVVTAHGKMDKERLEAIWADMTAGKIDVLVCTTIIETGVDVPNANTLIVDSAHRMGLSQLHQLRGRVGRSSRRAYAYFTYPRGRALSEIAEKRLEAIREYAEFGAGFRIALRDLEIRGAGSILGAEQHGHLDDVGYDMYVKLLNEAVLEEKGEKPAERTECTVTISQDAYLPASYVPSGAQRMALYKRIAHITSQQDADELYDELLDRYGEPPAATGTLLDIALLRHRAEQCGITAVTQSGGDIRIVPSEFDPLIWQELSASMPSRLRAVLGSTTYVTLRLRSGEDAVGIINRLFEKYIEIRDKAQ